jgi:lipopolysaccharide transport system permease protein
MPAEQGFAAAAPPATVRTVRRIQPSRGLVPIDFRELVRYRELLVYLLWRDVKARYKQTFLGAFWAIFRPFASMVLFAAVFGGLAHIESGSHVPYPLFLYAGLLGWTYLSSAVTSGASSVVANASVLSKAYFPRLFAPLGAVSAPLVDLLLALVVLFGLFPWYHRTPSWHLVFLPVFVLLALLTGLGIGLWLSGITVRYRDVPFALVFLVQLWTYATPVIYPASFVPDRYRWLLDVNPATAVVEGFRWSLLGVNAPGAAALAGSCGFVLLVVTSGLYFFRRTERTIVDLM